MNQTATFRQKKFYFSIPDSGTGVDFLLSSSLRFLLDCRLLCVLHAVVCGNSTRPVFDLNCWLILIHLDGDRLWTVLARDVANEMECLFIAFHIRHP